MKIIGLTGTNGSGKGSAVDIFKKKIKVIHVSARDLIVELAKNDGVNISNRDDLREYNEKRNREGKTLIQELKKYFTIENQDKILIFESVRRVSEIKELKDLFGNNFIMIGVDAPIEMRYQRNSKRGSMSDDVSFEKFKEQEKLESENEDENQMNLPKCFLLCDCKVFNNESLEKFERDLEEIIKNKILKN